MPAARTRPHPSRPIRHALDARLSSPDIFARPLLRALAARLAEEIADVMHEDGAVGTPARIIWATNCALSASLRAQRSNPWRRKLGDGRCARNDRRYNFAFSRH